MTDHDVCDICSGPCETCGRQMAESATARKWKQGDHPDVIAITYGREHKAGLLVQQLMQRKPVAEWAPLARRMLDRDLLSNDKFWWSLLALTDRDRNRNPKPSELPSYATRIAAAHQMSIAAAVAAIPVRRVFGVEPDGSPIAPDIDIETFDYPEAQRIAYARSGGACEAEGLHHRNCPGQVTGEHGDQFFITHHIYPREKAKQQTKTLRAAERRGDPDAGAEADRIAALIDHPANLVFVYNGHTGLAAGGCHGRIHRERTLAKDLGLLADSLDHVSPTIPKG